MEQASNTFSRGLQTDTHPMIQGNDSLSDALNATFVTMNGNEVILQNDMGNRRVDHAYLPAGYQPVGMKEYGGIIYVAAYNPITNRSQIGSFPSPERKMGTEYKGSLGGNWDPNIFTNNKNITTDSGLNFLIADTSLLKLTDDNSLHAGDKFAVYSSTIYNRSDITNLNNTSNGKVISPKNKQYTLALGILNSQNEFVDITKTLHRWSGNNIINEEGKSEIYKFNDGYFIASSYNNEWDRKTEADSELLRNRLAKPTNTYAYKLVGPLYLKTTLNHIENVSYDIYGIYNNSKATLWVEATITYNCPDGLTSGGNSDDNYITYAEGQPSFTGFDFYKLGQNTLLSPAETKKSNCQYNPATNLYTVTILKKYTNVTASNGDILNYYFCVPAINNIYLKGLSEKGSIDLSLLGSGTVKLTGWRFYNSDTNQTTLTYSFNAYPEYHKRFSNLSFKFTNVQNGQTKYLTEEDGLVLNNGRNTIIFDWENQGFIERSLYKVTISYNITDTDTGSSTSSGDITTNEWFLTTQLFNNCYKPSHNDYMNDFGSTETQAQNIRNKYCTVELELSVGKIINNSPQKTVKTEEGKILIPNSQYLPGKGIEMKYIHEQNININIQTSVSIKNKELYPSYVEINTNPTFNTSGNINVEELQTKIDFKVEPIENMITLSSGITTRYNNGTINTAGKIQYLDYYHADGKDATNLSIENGFTTLSDAIEKLIEQTKSYTGLFLDSEWHYGDDDSHWFRAMVNSSKMFDHRASNNEDEEPEGDVTTIWSTENGDPEYIKVSEYYSKITEVFNKSDKENIFIFLGIGDGRETEYPAHMSNRKDGWHDIKNWKQEKPYARIWWRTANLNFPWALLEIPWYPTSVTSKNGLANIIKNHFVNPDKMYICFYKNLDLSGKFKIPDPSTENYNYEYNIIAPISILISQRSSGSVKDISNAPIHFKTKTVSAEEKIQQNLDIQEISLNSSQSFQEIVSNTENISTKNITIDGGISKDSSGDDLAVNSVYILENQGLVIKNNSKITPNSQEYGGQYLGFLYGNSTTHTPNTPDQSNGGYKYDLYGSWEEYDEDWEDYTSLSYESINMVKKNQIDG